MTEKLCNNRVLQNLSNPKLTLSQIQYIVPNKPLKSDSENSERENHACWNHTTTCKNATSLRAKI